MIEKITKCLIILVFAVIGVLLSEFVSSILVDYIGVEVLKVGFLGVTVLDLVMGCGRCPDFCLYWQAGRSYHQPEYPAFFGSHGYVFGRFAHQRYFCAVHRRDFGPGGCRTLGTSFSRLPIVGPYISLIFSILGVLVGAKVALNKRADIISFLTGCGFPGTRTTPRKPITGTFPALINFLIPAF